MNTYPIFPATLGVASSPLYLARKLLTYLHGQMVGVMDMVQTGEIPIEDKGVGNIYYTEENPQTWSPEFAQTHMFFKKTCKSYH